jgi:hypothetical protein
MSMETPECRFSPFADRFRVHTLPVAPWTHQAHPAVRVWRFWSLGSDRARRAVCTGIRA